MRGLIPLALCLTSSLALAAPEVELTFDDGPDGSGPGVLNNMETKAAAFGEGKIAASLVGAARRSAIDAGRYGRAADLRGGDDGIELTPWAPTGAMIFFLWLKPRGTDAGHVLTHPDSWDLHFDDGALVVGAFRRDGEYVQLPTEARWPADDRFHHLTVIVDPAGGMPRVTVAIDEAAAPPVAIDFLPPLSDKPFYLGSRGFDGLLDEVLIKSQDGPTDSDRFDRSPGFCPEGMTCLEEVITVTPRDFDHPVPVRYKWIYDAEVCTPADPCPVVFDVSGGNACPDDYDVPNAVKALADWGLMVINVDIYCEADEEMWQLSPHETSQLIAVKDHVFAAGALRDSIVGPEYLASGCSHGAGLVLHWATREGDHPARTYARSAGGSGLCGHVTEKLCDAVTRASLAKLGIETVDDVDLEDPTVRATHERADLVGLVDAELASTREIARSWGVNQDGPVCRGDGSVACNEQGLWAMKYASERFRDAWQRVEPADAPTGYFVQDISRDCQHCAQAASKAFFCGACMLTHGRVGMEARCPECLDYSQGPIERGDDGELCPMEASWYVDPLAAPADDADAGPGGSDAAPSAADAGGGGAQGSGGDGGCGCDATSSPTGASPWLALLLLGLRRRRR